jgi:ubiquinone/menaquinone biosynthesis C-methylase UbiE
MAEKFSLEQIRAFWTDQALEHGQAPAASWSDTLVMDMEIRQIVARLSDGDRVLDIGCANGYSTLQLASHRKIRIRGLDYIPEMIAEAQKRLAAFDGKLQGSAEFAVGDITSLQEPAEAYDAAITIRVLINLGDWDSQRAGLRECARVVKSGGTLLISEATVQGWQRLNRFRNEWELPDIPMPPFNQYLDEDAVVEALSVDCELVEIVNFASSYYVGTRVLKPLLAKALAGGVNAAKPDMEWNRWFSGFPAVGDYGTQKLFVFRKR